jgi:hypothetical protein
MNLATPTRRLDVALAREESTAGSRVDRDARRVAQVEDPSINSRTSIGGRAETGWAPGPWGVATVTLTVWGARVERREYGNIEHIGY